MSAAATAAGYLYACGRLRGCAAHELERQVEPQQPEKSPSAPASKKTPKIEYRARRRSTLSAGA